MAMDVRPKFDGTQIEQLLKGKKGTIHYVVEGFRVPFRVTGVSFFRLRMSTKVPGKYERETRFRENDLMHLEGAVKIVRKWRKERGA